MASVAAAMVPANALAYVGPGSGITLVAALWGVLIAVVLAVGGLLFWPIRSLIRRRKAASRPQTDTKEPRPS